MNLADLRKHYSLQSPDEQDVHSDAIEQFNRWMHDAIKAEVPEANAMVLSTASTDGRPSSRVVLLKGVENNNFVFFTNYLSDKAGQIAENPHVSLCFLWHSLERQVRIIGTASKINEAASEAYFEIRPRGSQIGAWASAQSAVIKDRSMLEKQFADIESHFEGKIIPKPEHWGGFAVVPTEIEFWQGRASRLHDRIRYSILIDGTWKIERLSP